MRGRHTVTACWHVIRESAWESFRYGQLSHAWEVEGRLGGYLSVGQRTDEPLFSSIFIRYVKLSEFYRRARKKSSYVNPSKANLPAWKYCVHYEQINRVKN